MRLRFGELNATDRRDVGAARQVIDQVRYVWTHPANRGLRVRALGRSVRYQLAARFLGHDGYGRVGDRGVVRVRLHDNGASQSMYANPADFAEMMFWRRWLRPGQLFVDVGANVGLYTLWAIDCGARVWAFEPDEQARGRLLENLELSDMSATVFDCVLGDRDDVVEFSVGLGTGNRLNATNAQGRSVDMKTLDSIRQGEHISGLKLDVEGAERLVLEGSAMALSANEIEVLQVEWNFTSELTLHENRAPVAKLLDAAGYRLFRPIAGKAVALSAAEVAAYGADVFAASPTAAKRLGLA